MKNRILNWFKEHKTHRGKWSLIGRIAKDLNIETFEIKLWHTTYSYNNEIAIALNELKAEGVIVIGVSGRAYTFEYVGGE